MDGGEYKQQDVKFVEWSLHIADAPDVLFIIDRMASRAGNVRVLDVGGGIGTLAKALADKLPHAQVDVIDPSGLARDKFVKHDRTRLIFADFLQVQLEHRYDAVIFRTVLHHIIGDTEQATRKLQLAALNKARSCLKPDGRCYVIENFYEPMFMQDLTGAMIFGATKLKSPAKLMRRLGANTAGEGVRFRSSAEWNRMFGQCALQQTGYLRNQYWGKNLPAWQRLPLLCTERFQALVELGLPE